MYTQCPECGVAFRVTAEVLKMAAGKVRCGGCGVAFNALNHLSEQKPLAPSPPSPAPDPDLPELSPEEPGELEADTPPQTISAEQSAALLKTLDQLSGEDIRIEDTGVEWRVLGEDEEETEDTPFEQAPDEPSQVIDEMLFDDNTVLPDDFDEVVDAPPSSLPADPQPAVREPEAELEEPQFDLDLSDPGEWDDLLGDFTEPDVAGQGDSEPEVAGAEAVEDIPEQESGPETGPLDVDTQFAIQAEAMGINLGGAQRLDEAPADDEEVATHEDVLAEDLSEEPDEAAETSIDEDLIAAAFEAEATMQVVEDPAPDDVIELDDDGEAELELGEDEEELEEPEDDGVGIELQVEDEDEIEDDVDDIARGFDDKVEDDIATLSMSLDDEPEEVDASVEIEEIEDSVATTGEEHIIPEMSEEEKTINMLIDEELFNIAVEDEDGFASTIVQLQPDKKVDGEIEGNKSKPGKKDKKRKKDKGEAKDDEQAQPALAVETIVMEGEAILGEFDKQLLADKEKADAASAADTAISIPLNREKDDYARRREMTTAPPGTGIYVGIAALVLLLILQVIHQSREALATVPAFNSAVGPVYRMLGQPLTPTWNIGGWRFEATKGDTDEKGDVLTIYSRIGNNSDAALPYPLVHLSLTDRFEEVIGSAVLEPADFLPENADPRKLVPPGNTFNAVIAVESPSENATGFKLNVCYRLASGQLRCADQDFK
jgi:predicted Zn finger-like uncharacterized protein